MGLNRSPRAVESALFGALLCVCAACSGGSEPVQLAPRYELQHVSAWPGGGLQLVAAPSARLHESPVVKARLLRAEGEALEIEQRTVNTASGLTALVIAPTEDAAQHAARLEVAASLVLALPAGERIALWLGAESLPLLADTTAQRAHVLERIATMAPEDRGPCEPEALQRLHTQLSRLGAALGPLAPTLIQVGSPLSGQRAGHEFRVDCRAQDACEIQAAAEPEPESALDVDAAAARLIAAQAHTRAGTIRVAACRGFSAGEALTLQLGAQSLSFMAPEASELTEPACDASAAAADAYPLADTISLELDPPELELHDRYAAERSRARFTLKVKLPGAPAIPASVNFRGQTSLKCERKSYNVRLLDERRRRLFAGASVSEFYLLSLCTEAGGFRQVLANRLMRELDLFPMEHRYVRLQVAGRERGVYLLIEKPHEKVRDSQSALSAVIRRRDETEGAAPEVEHPRAQPQPALEQYGAIEALVDTAEPDGLYEALSQKLDLASYLRWLGFHSIFQTGDYVDEVFFFASDESAALGGGWYFRNLSWDMDDLFAPCHNRGEAAHVDPHELVYCAESRLDRALFVSDEVYARFVEALVELMDGKLALARVERELAQVKSDLLAVLSNDAVCIGGLGEIDGQPATCDELRPWLDGQIDAFVRALHARDAKLRERIARYEAAQ